jgi:hypothetical protein
MGTDASFSPASAAAACSRVRRFPSACRKALRRFLRFIRGTDSLQRPVPVDPHSEPRRGPLSDRILIAANRCAALFVSPVSPETRIGTAACASAQIARNGFHGERLIAKKPLRRFLRFTRGTDSLQRPVPVDRHSEAGQGSLSDRACVPKSVAPLSSFNPWHGLSAAPGAGRPPTASPGEDR